MKKINRNLRWPATDIFRKTLYETPYDKTCKQIFEKCHIYALEDLTFHEKIMRAYNEAVNQIFPDFRKLVQVYKDSPDKYACVEISDIVPGIKTCKMFLHLIDEKSTLGEGLSIAIPGIIDNGLYSNEAQPLFVKNGDGFDVASIIVGIPAKPLNKLLGNEFYIGVIKHEIMHNMLSLVSERLGVDAGRAWWVTNEIANELKCQFPTYSELTLNLDKHGTNIPNEKLIYLIAACIYYLDVQEYSAWLQSFYTEAKARGLDNIQTNESYSIFLILYKLLVKYKSQLNNLTFPPEVFDLILFYLKETFHIKSNKISIKNLVNYWIRRSGSYLKKCQDIHKKLIAK